MEDFIYLLLGVAWVLFSIYNAKKKKERKIANSTTSKKQNSTTAPSILDSLVKEIGLKENFDSPYSDLHKSESTDPVMKPEASVFSYDDYYEEGNFENEKAVLVTEAGTTKRDKSELLSVKKTKITKDTFRTIDLRKAVLYSEILNKKYF